MACITEIRTVSLRIPNTNSYQHVLSLINWICLGIKELRQDRHPNFSSHVTEPRFVTTLGCDFVGEYTNKQIHKWALSNSSHQMVSFVYLFFFGGFIGNMGHTKNAQIRLYFLKRRVLHLAGTKNSHRTDRICYMKIFAEIEFRHKRIIPFSCSS